ncbi:MAG TPA: hypothetical protein VGL86_25565 [Polyangia bacterium]|jgi:hypothetical protein
MTRLALIMVATLGLSATAWAQDFEAAGKHFSAAQEAFGAKHFKIAATEFEAAYAITKDPVLLYNVAESYEKAGDGHAAVANYKAYLKEQPLAQDKPEVQRRIKAIEGKGYKIASQSAPGDNPPSATTAPATPPPVATTPSTPPPSTPAPLPPPPVAPPPTMPSTAPTTTETTPPTPLVPPPSVTPTPPPPTATAPEPAAVPQATPPPGLIEEGPTSKLRVAAWIGVAATLAVVTAGAIFGLSAESRADEINRRLTFVDTTNQPHKFDQSTQSDLQSLTNDGHLYNNLAIAFYTIAAASAVATVTMFVVDAKHAKPEKKQAWHLAPVAGKSTGGLAVGGTF